MAIKIDFTHVHHVPCAHCHRQEDAGGLELVDDQKVRKVLCRECTLRLVTICLEPTGNGQASG